VLIQLKRNLIIDGEDFTEGQVVDLSSKRGAQLVFLGWAERIGRAKPRETAHRKANERAMLPEPGEHDEQ